MRSLLRNSVLSAALASILLAGSASGLSPNTSISSLTRGVDQPELGVERMGGRFKANGAVISLAEPAFTARAAAPETMAREFLSARNADLGLSKDDVSSLVRTSQRVGKNFSVVRFEQRQQGLPVYGSDIAISVQPNGKVIYVANTAISGLTPASNAQAKSESDSFALAKQYLGASEISVQKARKMIYATPNDTRIVWRVEMAVTAPHLGGWELLVDASSGEVLRAEELSQNVNGTATVWDPDPLSRSRATYGAGGFVDGNNADTPELTGALVPVTLVGLTQNGANVSLSGQYAVCSEIEPPLVAAACPSQPGTDFSVTRSAPSFDGVMVYYHVTRYMTYVNETLGVEAMPLDNPGGVKFDPNGQNGADNSRYNSITENLSFGHGGVNDGQDADVIIHELGHGIHDWITGGNAASGEGMGEGFGDYVAGAYSRDYSNQWVPGDVAFKFVFNWDGHNEFWPGRVLDFQLTSTYDQARTLPIHLAGQYWASCNLEARKNIQALDPVGGVAAFARAYFEGMSMTGRTTVQRDAAQAVINAAGTLGFTQAQLDAVGVAYNSGNQNGNTGCTYNVTVPGAGVDPTIVVDPVTLTGSALVGATTTTPLTIRNSGAGLLTWSIVEAADAARSHFPLDYRQATSPDSVYSRDPKLAPSDMTTSSTVASSPMGGVVNAFAQNSGARALVSLDLNTPGVMTPVGAANGQPFWGSAFLNGDTTNLFMLGDSGLFSVNTTTGARTVISATAGGGDVWGMTADPTTQRLYWVGPTVSQRLSTVDSVTGVSTLIAPISGAAAGDTINAIAADGKGRLFGTTVTANTLISIDKATGNTAVIGSLGVDVTNLSGLVFDPASGTLYFSNAQSGVHTINVATGAATLVGTTQGIAQLVALAIPGGGAPAGCDDPSDVPWLTATPASGSTAAGATATVTVSMNATGLAAGSYSANLCVASNDANNPLVTVPVSFTVTASTGTCNVADTIFCDGFDTAAPAVQPVLDPSFETTTENAGANLNWTGVDNNSPGDTPFWTGASAAADAHTGDFLAWGGGWGSASSQHWLQNVTIPSGGPRFLNFWRQVAVLPVGGQASLSVSVDGTQVWTQNLITAQVDPGWVNISVDISAFANNAAHEIRFDFAASGSRDGSTLVDDVTIDAAAGTGSVNPNRAPNRISSEPTYKWSGGNRN